MSDFTGTGADDTQNGAATGDDFDFSQGGNDALNGRAGDDMFFMGDAFTAADRVHGGGGFDTMELAGDYSAGLILQDSSIRRVNKIVLDSGHDYTLKFADGNVAAGAVLRAGGSLAGSLGSIYLDGSREKDGAFRFSDFLGDDTLIGGAQSDVLTVSFGADHVMGGSGDDLINVVSGGAPGAFTAADRFDGGAGIDTLTVEGGLALTDVVLADTTLTRIEVLDLEGGAFQLTMNNANVAAGARLAVDGTLATSLNFDGHAEKNGAFDVSDSAGDDFITGGFGNDTFDVRHGGVDTVNGGVGNDITYVGSTLTAADRISGDQGYDVVVLSGHYIGPIVLDDHTLRSVEEIRFLAGTNENIHLVLADGAVAHAQNLFVDASDLPAGRFVSVDGSHERNGTFSMMGSSGADTLIGGANADNLNGGVNGDDTLIGNGGADSLHGQGGNDVMKGGAGDDSLIGGDGTDTIDGGADIDFIEGGRGADTMTGGKGTDTFSYFAVADSTGAAHDTILDFNAQDDSFSGLGVQGVDAAINGGALEADVDAGLSSVLGTDQLAAHHAVVFTPDSGSLAGSTFLVVDMNGSAGYQAGQDLVIDITGATHLSALSLANFGA